MQKEQGIEVVCAAICAGIFNDLGSGSNVDLCVITKVFCLNNLGLQGCE
jgi:20S proteasome subunit beta 2